MFHINNKHLMYNKLFNIIATTIDTITSILLFFNDIGEYCIDNHIT